MTSRSNKLAALLGLALVVAASSSAQITKSGTGYLFRMKFTKGQTAKYTMDMKTSVKNPQNGQTQNITMDMPMIMNVLGVTGSVGNVQYKVGPMKMLMNGKPMPTGGQQQTQTLKLDSRGNVVGGGAAVQGMGTIGYPANPVKIGSSWTANTKTQAGPAGAMDVKATYKFIGLENVGGRQSAKLGVTMAGTGSAKVSGSGTMWIAIADGSLVKTNTKMNIVMAGNTMPMTMNIVRK